VLSVNQNICIEQINLISVSVRPSSGRGVRYLANPSTLFLSLISLIAMLGNSRWPFLTRKCNCFAFTGNDGKSGNLMCIPPMSAKKACFMVQPVWFVSAKALTDAFALQY
jgi:hypothetical protein